MQVQQLFLTLPIVVETVHSENASFFFSLYPSRCIWPPPKLTPWCQRGGTSQLTGRPCSCTQRQKVAQWLGCGRWSVKWRRPGFHKWLRLERHPMQPPGRRWFPGNHPALSLCQHPRTPQTGGITPGRRRRGRDGRKWVTRTECFQQIKVKKSLSKKGSENCTCYTLYSKEE